MEEEDRVRLEKKMCEGKGMMKMVRRSQTNRAQNVFLLTTGWTELTEYTPLIVLRSRLPHSPTDGLGVFTSTVTYFTIKIIKKKFRTLVGWCKFSKVVGYFGIHTRGNRSSLM